MPTAPVGPQIRRRGDFEPGKPPPGGLDPALASIEPADEAPRCGPQGDDRQPCLDGVRVVGAVGLEGPPDLARRLVERPPLVLEAREIPGDGPAPRLLPVEPAQAARRQSDVAEVGVAMERLDRAVVGIRRGARGARIVACVAGSPCAARRSRAADLLHRPDVTQRTSYVAIASWSSSRAPGLPRPGRPAFDERRGGARASSAGRSPPTCGPGSTSSTGGETGRPASARNRPARGCRRAPPGRGRGRSGRAIRATTGDGRSQTRRFRLSFRTSGSSTVKPEAPRHRDRVRHELRERPGSRASTRPRRPTC